ncbi:MAG: hypothetical protein ACRDA4_04665 [Filifactoraceae bacterium]
MMCNKVISNIAKVSYKSINGDLYTCYSNNVKTKVLEKSCMRYKFNTNSCINLYSILQGSYYIIDIDSYADILNTSINIENGEYVLLLEICLTQNMYYLYNIDYSPECFSYSKYCYYKIPVCVNLCCISDIKVCAYCTDYCMNDSNKLLINSSIEIYRN